MSKLSELYDELRAKCAADERIKGRVIVVGEGSESSPLLLIGEAPGGEEEKLGRAFVGSAGKNLDDFLGILECERRDIYITNLVKVRPTKQSDKTGEPVNRPPDAYETAFFAPFLHREIDAINPKLIVTLGNFSLRAVLRDKNARIGELHGKSISLGHARYKLFPLYHPAAIIYNQSLKETYYQDLSVLKQLLKDISAL